MIALPIENIRLRIRTPRKLPSYDRRGSFIERLARELNEVANTNGRVLGYLSLATHPHTCTANPGTIYVKGEPDVEDVRLIEELRKPTRAAGGFYGDNEIVLEFIGYICPTALRMELGDRGYTITDEGKRKSCADLQKRVGADDVFKIEARGGYVAPIDAEEQRKMIRAQKELEELEPKTTPESVAIRRKERSGKFKGRALTALIRARYDLALKQAGWL